MHTAQALNNVPTAARGRLTWSVSDLLGTISGAHKPPALRVPAGLSQTAPAGALRPADISALSAQGVDPRFAGINTRGKLAPFRAGPYGPYPVHYRPAFACSLVLYPQPHRRTLRSAYPQGRVTGLPRCIAETAWVGSCLYAGGSSSAWAEFGASHPGHSPFGPSLSASLACS